MNMHPLKFSAHTFSDVATADFDIAAYSKMKFGSDQAARIIGDDLANRFHERHQQVLNQMRCVIVPAPGNIVPVASTLMSLHFMNRVNHLLAKRGGPTVDFTVIHRNLSYQDDYHFLDAETRRRLLAGDEIYMNRDFVKDKMLIFIDDVVITGAHEEKLARFLRDHGLENPHAFVSYARYQGDDPTIEARLNHNLIKTGACVFDLAEAEADHRVTTRAIRLILEMDAPTLVRKLKQANQRTIEAAYHAAINKGYHEKAAYRENYSLLSAAAHRFFA